MAKKKSSKKASTDEVNGRRVTASDVAKAAGVSRFAVSRAFTPGAYVAEDKRKLIQEVAESLGYVPNVFAANLKGKSSNLVAIVTGDLKNHYDAELIGQLVERITAMGRWPVVLGGGVDAIEKSQVLNVLAFPLEAIIVRAGSVDEALADKCAKFAVPMILSGRALTSDGAVDSIACDNTAGAQMAVDCLVKKRRKHIVYIGGPKQLTSEKERFRGFSAALRKHKLNFASRVSADFSFDGGMRAIEQIISSGTKFDAVFCSNDAMALGVLNALRWQKNVRVPKDVSLIGFDDIAMAEWPCFELTTVRNSIDQLVDGIMRILERRIAKPNSPGSVTRLVPELIERSTH